MKINKVQINKDLNNLINFLKNEIENENYQEILSIALEYTINQNWLEGIQYLLSLDINVDFQYSDDELTPLGMAVNAGNIDIIKLLLEAGASPDGRGLCCPLLDAVESKNMSIIKLLIEAGANVNLQNESEDTPLLLSIKRGDLDIVKYLVKKGATINTECHYGSGIGFTPLMAAAKFGNIEIVKFLVQSGASVNVQCYEQKITALYMAATQGHQEVFKYLLPLTSCREQYRAAIQELPNGIIRKQRREDKLTADFISAAAKGDSRNVKKAIESGVNIDAFGDCGKTALHKASERGHVDIIYLLAKAGASVEKKSEEGIQTPLEMAVESRQFGAVKALIELGANPHFKDSQNNTLLITASAQNALGIVRLLLSKGVDINAKNNNGFTALEIARRFKYPDIVQFLKKSGAIGNSEIEFDPNEIPF